MSGQYRPVSPGYWQDPIVRSWGKLPTSPHTLSLWILTGPLLGVLPGLVSVGRYGICEQIKWTPDELDENMAALVAAGMVQFDSDAPLLWLPKAIKYNAPRSPLNVMGWASDWRKLPSCLIKERAFHVLQSHCRSRDADMESKTKKTTKNSFETAFRVSIEKPKESGIQHQEHSFNHDNNYVFPEKINKEQEQEKEKDQDSRKNRHLSDDGPTGTVTPIDCMKSGGGR
ncbi:hypothetical protein [uncultured Paraglaciecola sp.]|uniref:hypothetical protein n=1 Tax=uncultured Paraglaciecola sp. TaxID=1765024 RepID=UPI00261B0AE9|nr:hypothetical protein [uncultured Paraglaciecola sp.]